MDEPELDELVQQFWRLESEGTKQDSKPSAPLDQNFNQILKDSINFNGQRFEIKLPWKENSNLENNCSSAHSQVKSLNRRLGCNPQFRDNYRTIGKLCKLTWKKTTLNQLRCKIHRRIESGISHNTLLRILTSPARFGAMQTPPLNTADDH